METQRAPARVRPWRGNARTATRSPGAAERVNRCHPGGPCPASSLAPCDGTGAARPAGDHRSAGWVTAARSGASFGVGPSAGRSYTRWAVPAADGPPAMAKDNKVVNGAASALGGRKPQANPGLPHSAFRPTCDPHPPVVA